MKSYKNACTRAHAYSHPGSTCTLPCAHQCSPLPWPLKINFKTRYFKFGKKQNMAFCHSILISSSSHILSLLLSPACACACVATTVSTNISFKL